MRFIYLLALILIPILGADRKPAVEGAFVDGQCNTYVVRGAKAGQLEVSIPQMNDAFGKWEIPGAVMNATPSGRTFRGSLRSNPVVELEGEFYAGWIDAKMTLGAESHPFGLIPRADAEAIGCGKKTAGGAPSQLEIRTGGASASMDGKLGFAVFLRDREGNITAAKQDVIVSLSAAGAVFSTPQVAIPKGTWFTVGFVHANKPAWMELHATAAGLAEATTHFCGCDPAQTQPVVRLALMAPARATLGETVPVWIRLLNSSGECASDALPRDLKIIRVGVGNLVDPPTLIRGGECCLLLHYLSAEAGKSTMRVTYAGATGDLSSSAAIGWNYPNSLRLCIVAAIAGLLGAVAGMFLPFTRAWSTAALFQILLGSAIGLGTWLLAYRQFHQGTQGWAIIAGAIGGYAVTVLFELLARYQAQRMKPV